MRSAPGSRRRDGVGAWPRWYDVHPLHDDSGKGEDVMAASVSKPIPVPTRETQPYWDGCKQHELRIQQCVACGHSQFYPRLYCTTCMSERVEWIRASGR